MRHPAVRGTRGHHGTQPGDEEQADDFDMDAKAGGFFEDGDRTDRPDLTTNREVQWQICFAWKYG